MIVIAQTMDLAAIGPDDLVGDQCSGEGRLVISAVKKHSARGGLGVDIDESLVRLSQQNAVGAGVGDRVRSSLPAICS